jgi:hypothetical protein
VIAAAAAAAAAADANHFYNLRACGLDPGKQADGSKYLHVN